MGQHFLWRPNNSVVRVALSTVQYYLMFQAAHPVSYESRTLCRPRAVPGSGTLASQNYYQSLPRSKVKSSFEATVAASSFPRPAETDFECLVNLSQGSDIQVWTKHT